MRKTILILVGATMIAGSAQAASWKEHRHVRNADQYASERFRNTNAALPAPPEAAVQYNGGMGGWTSMTGFN
jgi:hypothetical protein